MTPTYRPSIVANARLFGQLALLWALCGGANAAFAGNGDEETLFSYRRDSAANAAGAEPNAATAAASGGANPENPLRAAAVAAAAVMAPVEAPQAYQFGAPATPPTASATPITPTETAVPASPYAELASAQSAAPPLVESPAVVAALPPQSDQMPAAPPVIHHDAALQPAKAEESVAPPAEIAPHEAPAAATHVAHDVKPLLPGEPVSTVPDESRRLAPRSPGFAALAEQSSASPGGGLKDRLPVSFSRFGSLTTAGAGLAIVVGLFFVCMWLLRRSSGAKPTGVLPSEAFAVLGRAPLTPQSFAQLLRVGNKLVLVAVSADGIQPLTEVVDPLEVDRLTGVCASGRGNGPAAEFQQVLAQLAREPARGFLGAEAANGGGRRRA